MAAASPEGTGESSEGAPASAAGSLGAPGPAATPGSTPVIPALHEVPAYASEWSSPELQQLVAGKKYADTEQVAQAYQHAVAKLGADPSKLLTVPDWEDADASGKFFDSLGRPAEASGYTMLEGMDAGDQDIATRMQNGIHPLGLTDKQWTGVQKVFQDVGAEGLNALEQRQSEDYSAAKARLTTKWGGDFAANEKLGQQAVARLEIPIEALEGIESKLGYEGTMEWALALAGKVGEHSIDTGSGGGPEQFQMTPAEALNEYERMKADPEIVAKANAGDRAVIDRRNRLIEIISAEQSRDNTLTLR